MGNSFCIAAPNDAVVATITTTHPSPNTIVIAVGINNNNNNNNNICPSPLPSAPTPLDPEALEEQQQQQQSQSRSQFSADEEMHKSLRSTSASLATTTSFCTPLSINGGGGGGGGGSARRSNRKEREVSVSFLSDTVILHSPHSQDRGQSSCFATVLEQEQQQQRRRSTTTTTTTTASVEEEEDRSNTECSDNVLRSMTPLSLPDATAAMATNAALCGTLSPEGEPFQHASSRTRATSAAADCQPHALSASVSPSLNLSLRSCTSSSASGTSVIATIATSPSISASSVVAHLYHERDLMLVAYGEAIVAPLVDTESQEYFGVVRSGRETDDANGVGDPSHDNTTIDREEVTSDNDGGRDMESSQIFENVDDDAPCRDAQQLRIKVSSNSSTPPAKERRPPSPQVAVASPPLAEFLSPVSPSSRTTSQQLQLLSPRRLQQRSDVFRKARAVRHHRVIRRHRRRRDGEDVDTTALDDLPDYADDKDLDDGPLNRSEDGDDGSSPPPSCVSSAEDKELLSSSNSPPPKSAAGVFYSYSSHCSSFSSSSCASRTSEVNSVPVVDQNECAECAESNLQWQQQRQQQGVSSESSPPELSLGHVF